MIYYKMAGGVMLLACSTMLAVMKNRAAEAQVREAESLETLMRHIKKQIECFGLPISEIFKRCDEGLLRACGIDKEAAKDDPIAAMCASELKSARLCGIISDFATGFGKSYREEELRALDYYTALVSDERERLMRELPAKKRLNVTLSLSGTAALIILLI